MPRACQQQLNSAPENKGLDTYQDWHLLMRVTQAHQWERSAEKLP